MKKDSTSYDRTTSLLVAQLRGRDPLTVEKLFIPRPRVNNCLQASWPAHTMSVTPEWINPFHSKIQLTGYFMSRWMSAAFFRCASPWHVSGPQKKEEEKTEIHLTGLQLQKLLEVNLADLPGVSSWLGKSPSFFKVHQLVPKLPGFDLRIYPSLWSGDFYISIV